MSNWINNHRQSTLMPTAVAGPSGGQPLLLLLAVVVVVVLTHSVK